MMGATASSPLKPSGFDYEFVPPLHDDFICPICHLAMKDPVQTTICGHSFCRECLAEFHRGSRRVCPMDILKLAWDQVFPDTATKRKILNSPMMCPNNGCEWIGELSQVEKHRKACPFETVTCLKVKCQELVIRRELHNHMTSKCAWREHRCVYCEEIFPFYEKQVHEQTCRRFPVKCTNECNPRQTMPREQLKSHLDKTCPLTLLQCYFHNIGCTEKVQRRYLNQHLENNTQIHLCFASKRISEMRETIGQQKRELDKVKEEAVRQSEELKKLSTENKKQKEEENNIKTQNEKRLRLELDKVKEEAMKQSKEFRRLIAEHQRLFEKLLAENRKQEKEIIAQKEVENREKRAIRGKSKDQERKNTPAVDMKPTATTIYVWKISKSSWSKSFTLCESQPFYTELRGYKLRLELSDFDITDPRSSMSFSIAALHGEYDDELVWPFRKTISITVVNQEDGGHQWDIKREALVCLDKLSILAAILGRVRDIDSIRFQSVISSEQLKQRKYIVDNTVIVRVDVVNK